MLGLRLQLTQDQLQAPELRLRCSAHYHELVHQDSADLLFGSSPDRLTMTAGACWRLVPSSPFVPASLLLFLCLWRRSLHHCCYE